MQIYGASQLHGAQSIHGPHAARPAESTSHSGMVDHTADRLEISDAGRIAAQMAEIPEIRHERVESIRAALLNGTYETEDKLSLALDRLLDEIA